MRFMSLSQTSTLLAPSYQHGFLRVLFSSDPKYANVDILTVENRLRKHASCDSIEQLFQARNLLEKHTDTIFKKQLQDPAFIMECLRFSELMKLSQITIDSLPQDTAEEIALKDILRSLFPLKTPADELLQAVLNLDEPLDQVWIMPARYTAAAEILIDHLLEKGARFLEQRDQLPTIECYHAVNIRQEAEACAQYILTHHIDAQSCVILLADTNLLPYIKQTFQHYQIPITVIHEHAADATIRIVEKLLIYYLEPTAENVLAVLNSDLIRHPYLSQLIEYMQLFHTDIRDPFQHIQKLECKSKLISKQDKARLDRLESRAEEARGEVMNRLKPILNAESYEQVLTAVYEQIYHAMPTSYRRLENLQKLFQSAYPMLHQPKDVRFFIQYLHTLSSSIHPEEYQGAVISDLSRPMPSRPYLFLLGCTQANYPGFPAQQGFFDEAYVRKIAYPSMDTRYQKHIRQLEAIMRDCQHLILSYAQGDFSGKGQEAALEIELFAGKKFIPYPLQSEYGQYPLQPQIQPITARKLFVKDGIMQGSISSLERYISCPFAYFLKYGLKIREPLDNTFSSNRIGTLAHLVLESLVTKYGKQYAKADPDEIRLIIHQELSMAGKLYTAQKDLFEMLEERLFNSLTSMMEILKDMEQHTRYQPMSCEYPFTYSLDLDEHTVLALKGIIDRLDVCDDFIRIIDYKSSHKQLSETKVFAAQQLQLLTYALIAQDAFRKIPAGAYYYSLKNENITADAGKMKRRPVAYTPLDHFDYEDQKRKAQRLDGWTFETDGQLMDDDGRHIKGFSVNKNEEIKIRKVYDLDVLRVLVKQMYAVIAARIQSGRIELTPAQNACLFCNYHPICRYHGLSHEKEALVEPDETLYRKEG